MLGRICMVTGATSGMGLVSAEALAQMGATVIIVGRNKEKCERTVASIKSDSNNQNVEYLLANFSSFEQIRQLVKDFSRKYSRLDVLINNAGAFYLRREVSEDGFEMTLAVNYLSHFLLTNLLMPALKKSSSARIINVSSAEHLRRGTVIDFDNLMGKNKYRGWRAYNQSKLAVILFTYELARRLRGTKISVNVVHPGWVATNIGKNNSLLGRLLVPIVQYNAISPEEGARPIIYLASSPKVQDVTGQYFNKYKSARSSRESYNKATAKKLWGLSENMTEIH